VDASFYRRTEVKCKRDHATRCLQPLLILSSHTTKSQSRSHWSVKQPTPSMACIYSWYYKRRTPAKEPITAPTQHDLRPHVAPWSCTPNTSPAPLPPLASGPVTPPDPDHHLSVMVEGTSTRSGYLGIDVTGPDCARLWDGVHVDGGYGSHMH